MAVRRRHVTGVRCLQVRDPFAPLATGQPSPLANVLRQEVHAYNTLLAVVQQSLQELQQAVQGTPVLSHQLEAILRALMSNQVRPPLFAKLSDPST